MGHMMTIARIVYSKGPLSDMLTTNVRDCDVLPSAIRLYLARCCSVQAHIPYSFYLGIGCARQSS